MSDRNPGFTDADAADLDTYVGLCHLCDETRRVVAVDARFQHMQTSYCVPCLAILVRRLGSLALDPPADLVHAARHASAFRSPDERDPDEIWWSPRERARLRLADWVLAVATLDLAEIPAKTNADPITDEMGVAAAREMARENARRARIVADRLSNHLVAILTNAEAMAALLSNLVDDVEDDESVDAAIGDVRRSSAAIEQISKTFANPWRTQP